ncbi:hypothetical protein A7U60_g5657 [Sanghuangporus baumii]|uniref:Uncharacterized protein n=1 Tax=Sanghuangporus baumii TaxID=108892 RepID=A0A9Q5HW79_SANBA|nr:hypothetical protein A7U60_g5657 [Sanghuangporus baumii]
MLRVLALYSQKAAFTLGLSDFLTVSVHIGSRRLAEGITLCTRSAAAPWVEGMVVWLVPMTYGVLLMVLALQKAAEYWKMSAGLRGFKLVKVLIRDQVVYFGVVITCSLFAILSYKIQISNAFLSEIFESLGDPCLLSLLGSRMLVNLKEAAEQGQNVGTSYRMTASTMSEMDFCADPTSTQRLGEADQVGKHGEA